MNKKYSLEMLLAYDRIDIDNYYLEFDILQMQEDQVISLW